MKQEQPMAAFFKRVVKDKRIIISHISLFAAICQCWQSKSFADPIPVTRRELMRLSKIASFATYHKCIKELHEMGYIRYEPSYRPTGSLIYWPKILSEEDPGNQPYYGR